ncbi:hypothetical protein TSUD_408390 [Trifolium subterraneum]|uniref:DUF4283 domain-containing protein n=1 Tax=Trifolium subterraneum TaxID=3900 RepID=A0A2Z6P0M1_TRISU|nr:hypothetical protein TSUD_408390 [Trifolium subterraneum]
MQDWKKVSLSKEEEEIVAGESVVCSDESFKRSLVGKLWTEDHFNVRIFKQVISQDWSLKNQIEIQDLSKNLFLFRFATKRDLETVLKNGLWSFDRNLVVLKRISGEEQPSDLEIFSADFWARIYDLPLKLRSDAMAEKLGNTIGKFVEVDIKEGHRLGKFLRLKTTVDLRKPLKRGTVINFQGKKLQVFFKKRTPIWLMAESFPLPKVSSDIKKEQSPSSCNKSLFSETSTSKGESKESSAKGLEIEVVSEIRKGKSSNNKEDNAPPLPDKAQYEVDEMERIRNRCGFSSCILVACSGSGRDRAGGLSCGRTRDRGDDWFLSCIYGHPEENNKWRTWELIKQTHDQVGHKWLCIGDLNDMLQVDDKKGGLVRSQSQLGIGTQTVEACGLNDMGFEGYPFTWTNGRQRSKNVQCRLDKALGTKDFLNRFSPWKVSHLQRYGSDHAAILIQLEHHDCGKKKRVHLFRFKDVWTKDKRCEEEVRQVWNGVGSRCTNKVIAMKSLDQIRDFLAQAHKLKTSLLKHTSLRLPCSSHTRQETSLLLHSAEDFFALITKIETYLLLH